MKMSLDGNLQDRSPTDNDDTDRVDLDKESWRTIAFVLALLAATIGMIVVLASSLSAEVKHE